MITREDFDGLCDDLVERTLETVREVLTDQKLKPNDIAEVLLVGGSTRMPMVREALQKFFGRPATLAGNPDLVVALGVALCAQGHRDSMNPLGLAALPPGSSGNSGGGLLLRGRTITDVTPHSLGMIAVNENSTAYVNSIILPRDLSVPRRETRPFQHQTRPDDDNLLDVFMTQGEFDAPDKVTYLGRYVIRRIPHHSTGTKVIDIDYAYDLSGSVQVTARDGTHTLEVEIETLPDDVPQRFLQTPPVPTVPHVTVYLTFDLSGSMSGSPLVEAQKAARAFMSQIDLSHCSLGVMVVADRTQTVLSACQDATQIERAIESLHIGMVGGGNAAHPFDEAMSRLKSVEGPRFVVTLADGV